jgi:hypothetical protein
MTRLCVTLIAALCALPLAAAAQPGPQNMRPGPAKNIICPAQLQVRMSPAGFVVGGWTANTGPFPVQLDPANPPHFSGGQMVCSYKLLNQPDVFNLYQPVGTQKCQVLSNGTGFICAAW